MAKDEESISTRIIETTFFTKAINRLIDDDGRQHLMDELIKNPDLGDLIQGSGGCRKLRWAGSGRGKRGGIRVIYFWRKAKLLFLLTAYPKNAKDDLSGRELKVLRAVVESELANG